ncbi:SMI1/KNR4 family protein [Altererythrobacter arenosus]|uniref:SMI1/KNR4 family protein n=1 Tax=Altererythrobacter arenosus TaxID=3032592 RepID=A0ABY8FYB6_9SPHN|nr:SMI1/KNR4 family protein [Altererythrobacter sp. CAU 1644]WFL79023.1 SMI1/KNR4 family protein [Altererythrobacter sp. CAU 1644]
MDFDAIREKLAALAEREWPENWGAREQGETTDFYGWSHHYRMEPTASEHQVAAFEQAHGVTLPEDYRKFLIELGNGGAGPGYGIFPLGEGEEEQLPQELLQNLSTDFSLIDTWNESRLAVGRGDNDSIPDEDYYSCSVIAGAIEIATDGCALFYLLVVSGPGKGQIWFDKRADGEGVVPVRDERGAILTFGPWYQRWLDDAFRRWTGG